MNDQSQRDYFAKQLALLLKISPLTFQDWSDIFEYLSIHLNPGDIVLFDEISWMGSKDPSFIPKLKAWWDKQTLAITIIFCGCVSTWIEENILKSTALGFVKKQALWSFKTTQPLKQSLYRICDPYMRFYLKLIESQRNKIDLDGFEDRTLSQLPGFDSHIGLQFEQLLLQNRSLLLKAIGISGGDIVADGPYQQSRTKTQKGCQIDYLIQTLTKNLFICEFKFKCRELKIDIINDMKEKIKALKIPKGFATVPVLFHIGAVSSSVAIDGYFYRIIDTF